MGIDPNIALSGVQPANPLDTIGKAMNLKSLMQGQQLHNLEIQQKQLQVQDQQATTEAMKEWDGQDMNALPTLILKHGGSSQAVMGMKSNILGYQKELASKNELDLKNEATKADVISGHIANIKQLPMEQQPGAYTGAIHDLVQRGYMTPQEAMQHPYPGPDGLDSLEKMYMGHGAQIEEALKVSQTAQANAHALLANAQAPGAAAKSAQDQAATAAQLMSGANAMNYASKRQFALSKGIDQNIIPEQFSPQGMQQLQSTGLTPEQTVQAQQKQAELKQGAQRVGIEAGRLGEEKRHNKEVEGSLLTGDAQAALVNVPMRMRTPATAAKLKADDEYIGAANAQDEMNSFISLAKGGNKLAYAYAPTTGVLTINTANGVKRVNMPEIESYGAAGSAWDRVKGFFGKAASGASIPNDVLNDMQAVHDQLGANAGVTYQRKVDAVNQTYGATFKPISIKKEASSSVTHQGRAVRVNGQIVGYTTDGKTMTPIP